MPVNYDTLNRELHDVLRSRGYDPISLDSKGDPTDDIEESDVFRFTVTGEDGEKINAWATVEGNNLVLYIDDKFTEHKDFETFAHFLKRWSQRKLLGFDVSNKDRLLGDMKKRTVMNKKENMLEGYHPMGKKASYSDNVPEVKIILQHTRQIEEGEQRFRNIAKIFVENLEGERFLLPTNRPGLARVYARHIAEGGTPYDDKGRHITTLVEEYSQMAGFVRATRNGQFNESALALVNEGLNHYNTLRMTLQGMASHRGYNKYFESYTPVLNEESDDDISLNELFVQETLDPRIESVMPILKRLSKNVTEMTVVKELDEWAESITEVEDETTKTLAVPADEMLEGDLPAYHSGIHVARYPSGRKPDVKVKAGSPVEAATKAAKHWGVKRHNVATYGIVKGEENHPRVKDLEMIDEAPGAETLAHNDDTEEKNLKAFGLAEDRDNPVAGAITRRILMQRQDLLQKFGPVKVMYAIDDVANGVGDVDEIGSSDVSGWVRQVEQSLGGVDEGVVDTLKKVGKKVADYIAPGDEELLKDLQKKAGIPKHAQHGKPRMAVPKDEVSEADMDEGIVGNMINKAKGMFKKPATAPAAPAAVPVAAKAAPGMVKKGGTMDMTKKVVAPAAKPAAPAAGDPVDFSPQEIAQMNKDLVAMDPKSLAQAAARTDLGPTVTAAVKAEVARRKTAPAVAEDLDADQKRVGQLGPTEKVGPKGAVGKLVGTSESREFEDIKRLAGLK
jgi:hypothetical protein